MKRREPGLTNGRLGILCRVELNHSGAARATVGLVLDLGALNLTNGGEELN